MSRNLYNIYWKFTKHLFSFELFFSKIQLEINKRIQYPFIDSKRNNFTLFKLKKYILFTSNREGKWCATSQSGSSGFDSHPEIF